MIAVLLDDGPVLILCPSTLTLQWQVELTDKLGIPSVVWSSSKKVWIDPKGHIIKTRGPEDIARCPFRIAIVSTGLIFHDSDERKYLLERKYGTVVLDEAHKARRRGGLGQHNEEPNKLLEFMLRIGSRTKNLMLGTATPIQTEVHELWDLLRILNAGADFVLGRKLFGRWAEWEKALPVVKGEETPIDEQDAWEWLRNPLPPGSEDALFAEPDEQMGLAAAHSLLEVEHCLGRYARQTGDALTDEVLHALSDVRLFKESGAVALGGNQLIQLLDLVAELDRQRIQLQLAAVPNGLHTRSPFVKVDVVRLCGALPPSGTTL